MNRIILRPGGQSVSLNGGDRVLDALDDAELTGWLEVQCRAANCGSCKLRIAAGGGALRPPTAREREALAQLRAAEGERLGCQLELEPGADAALIVLERAPRQG